MRGRLLATTQETLLAELLADQVEVLHRLKAMDAAMHTQAELLRQLTLEIKALGLRVERLAKHGNPEL